MSVFWFAQVVKPCITLACVARMALMSFMMIDNSTNLEEIVCVCAGERQWLYWPRLLRIARACGFYRIVM